MEYKKVKYPDVRWGFLWEVRKFADSEYSYKIWVEGENLAFDFDSGFTESINEIFDYIADGDGYSVIGTVLKNEKEAEAVTEFYKIFNRFNKDTYSDTCKEAMESKYYPELVEISQKVYRILTNHDPLNMVEDLRNGWLPWKCDYLV